MNKAWDEIKLLALISDQIEESDNLEYKGAGSLQKVGKFPDEICKDVSAFANAGGGVLIFGISEFRDKDRKHLPEKIEPVDRVDFTREWLEHVINNIQPRIPDLKIIPVPLASGQRHVAYVVEIPKGATAHQAPDGRYYRRYNFEALRMKDHEIRDVMGRKQHPLVETEIRMWMNTMRAEAGLFWKLTNVGNVIARHVMTSIRCPMQIRGLFLYEKNSQNHDPVTEEDGLTYYRLKGSNKLGLPLFPKSEISRVFRFNLSNGERWSSPVKHLKVISFQTFADEMPFISGEFNADNIVETVSSFE